MDINQLGSFSIDSIKGKRVGKTSGVKAHDKINTQSDRVKKSDQVKLSKFAQKNISQKTEIKEMVLMARQDKIESSERLMDLKKSIEEGTYLSQEIDYEVSKKLFQLL